MQFDKTIPKNADLFTKISQAMADAAGTVRKNPINRPRPNEVGNDIEQFVIKALNKVGLKAAAPRTREGKGKNTGYPDIRIETGGIPIFLEVKTYARANQATTQRSFYFSPTENPKVFEDGYHLLVGFEMTRNGNDFTPDAFKLLDLYGLECDMKYEFNSDNKRLYHPERLLYAERL